MQVICDDGLTSSFRHIDAPFSSNSSYKNQNKTRHQELDQFQEQKEGGMEGRRRGGGGVRDGKKKRWREEGKEES